MARRHALRELDYASALTTMSSVEATLRIDYLQRVYRRCRDPLSRAMRRLHQDKAHRVRLESDLIFLWKAELAMRDAMLKSLIEAFKYRHWLAHGRYWKLKLRRSLDFAAVYDIADTFIAQVEASRGAIEAPTTQRANGAATACQAASF